MNVALIVAGGVGKRMQNTSVPKQFLELHGKPIIIYTLEVFQNCAEIDKICIACVSTHISQMEKLCKKFDIDKVEWIVAGGATRQESIFNGLETIRKNCPGDSIVLIHDGVRPIITDKLLCANIATVQEKGNAISCAWATETFAEVDAECRIVSVPDRNNAIIAKSPQSFRLNDIYDVHLKCLEDGIIFVDSASMMRSYGVALHMVETSWDNIKITSPSDYYIFRAILEAKQNSRILGL